MGPPSPEHVTVKDWSANIFFTSYKIPSLVIKSSWNVIDFVQFLRTIENKMSCALVLQEKQYYTLKENGNKGKQ